MEPDEALAAVKKFLDSLDPHGLGRLVNNLDDDLKGNGAALNATLGSLSKLVSTFAEKDDQLGHIIDSFDRLTATLATRDQQLGQVLDAFAQVSQVLADERQSISGLVERPGPGVPGRPRPGRASTPPTSAPTSARSPRPRPRSTPTSAR